MHITAPVGLLSPLLHSLSVLLTTSSSPVWQWQQKQPLCSTVASLLKLHKDYSCHYSLQLAKPAEKEVSGIGWPACSHAHPLFANATVHLQFCSSHSQREQTGRLAGRVNITRMFLISVANQFIFFIKMSTYLNWRKEEKKERKKRDWDLLEEENSVGRLSSFCQWHF